MKFLKILFLIPLISFADIPSAKSYKNWIITKNAEDPAIKNEKGIFQITFKDSTGKKMHGNVRYGYNGSSLSTLMDVNGQLKMELKPGKYQLAFYYSSAYREVITDSITLKKGFKTEIDVFFRRENGNVKMCYKPVIYVYPEKKKEISVDLKLSGAFTFTYPEYKNGWKFVADTNGKILMNEKEYDYLFWEGTTDLKIEKLDLRKKFMVNSKHLISFFEDKLSQMGLNEREQEDFITFWAPLMMKNNNNYIHFIFNEEFNERAQLSIEPKPNNIYRVFMIWGKAGDSDYNDSTSEQKIPQLKREGFSVVEWGGTENNCFISNNP